MEEAFFIFFAMIAIGSALMVVLAKSPIRSALSLMVCFVQIAAIFVLLRSPFLAVIQIFVYVGAVMVLFLFVIMMLDVRKEAETRFLVRGKVPILTITALLGAEMMALVLASTRFPNLSGDVNTPPGTVNELSKSLFRDYLLPFEIASVILLVALVGAVVLTRKEEE